VVFSTKYRHPVFSGHHLDRLEEITRDVCTDYEAGLAEFTGQIGPVHLLVNYPPKAALSPPGELPSTACRPAGCGANPRTIAATTGTRAGPGPRPTSPAPPAARPSRSCASTSRSRTRPA